MMLLSVPITAAPPDSFVSKSSEPWSGNVSASGIETCAGAGQGEARVPSARASGESRSSVELRKFGRRRELPWAASTSRRTAHSTPESATSSAAFMASIARKSA